MAKMPFMKFYPQDYLYDTRILTLEERAVWMDLLCFLWNAPERGRMVGSVQDLAQMVGIEWLKFRTILEGLKRKNVLNLTESNEKLTLISRRMIREENERESNNIRQKRYYSKHQPNANLTPKKLEAKKLEAIKDLKNIAEVPSASSSKNESKLKLQVEHPRDVFWKETIAHLKATWERKKPGAVFRFSGKEASLLRPQVRAYMAWGVMALWDVYLSTDNDWYRTQGYSVVAFCPAINALVDNPLWKGLAKKYELKLNGPLPQLATLKIL
jgi:hypothetical protein